MLSNTLFRDMFWSTRSICEYSTRSMTGGSSGGPSELNRDVIERRIATTKASIERVTLLIPKLVANEEQAAKLLSKGIVDVERVLELAATVESTRRDIGNQRLELERLKRSLEADMQLLDQIVQLEAESITRQRKSLERELRFHEDRKSVV